MAWGRVVRRALWYERGSEIRGQFPRCFRFNFHCGTGRMPLSLSPARRGPWRRRHLCESNGNERKIAATCETLNRGQIPWNPLEAAGKNKSGAWKTRNGKNGGLRVQIRGANNRGPVQSYFHWRVTSVNVAIVYATGVYIRGMIISSSLANDQHRSTRIRRVLSKLVWFPVGATERERETAAGSRWYKLVK